MEVLEPVELRIKLREELEVMMKFAFRDLVYELLYSHFRFIENELQQ